MVRCRCKVLTHAFAPGNNYYKVVSDDTCLGIAYQHAITLSQFYTWNPAVGTNCQVLLAGYYVCVGISGRHISLHLWQSCAKVKQVAKEPIQKAL